jgi:hypothetical protein
MYKQIQSLDKILTNEDKIEISEKMEEWKKSNTDFDYELTNYMQRQPRVDLTKYNYNYEQYREFTHLYEEAKKKDDEELNYFYKMVKYSKINADKGDKSAMAFAKKFRLDLIEVPEEFKDISLDDLKIRKNKITKRFV